MKILYRNVYHDGRGTICSSKQMAWWISCADCIGIETVVVAPNGRVTVVIFEPVKKARKNIEMGSLKVPS